MFHLKLTLSNFFLLLLTNELYGAPYFDPAQATKDTFDGPNDIHRLSKRTLNHLITGLIGLLINLTPESRYPPRYSDPSYSRYY
ncbi:Hypothetical protein NTJ_05940 [Nesidiocoris tenuis]|uniref:Secreted protein n=1 Tax=Nesidiocoris tenuis TaxID=355587 RepID=A0ABN7ALM1_9HEMI|nr:Hypothetical protein NTJ_05940 [Nesidiocoris tenuis]